MPALAPGLPRVVVAHDDWLVVLKPPGLDAVPGRGPDRPHLLGWLAEQGYAGARTIGRLDRAAGGLMVLARTAAAQRRFDTVWHGAHTVKLYLARTLRPPEPAAGVVAAAIDRGRQGTMKLGSGRAARSAYTTLRRHDDGTALVAVRIFTGRRHQVRLHLASRGAPICGDTMYMRAAEVLAGMPGPTPPPQAPCAIDLWCARLVVPAVALDVAAPAPFAADVDPQALAVPSAETATGTD